jgi:hypothetical protein
MLVILVFVVQVKAEREIDPPKGKLHPSEPATNGAEGPDKPIVVMQHEDIERLLESTT